MGIRVHKKSQLTGHNASIYALVQGDAKGRFLSAGGDGWVVEWQTDSTDGRLIARTDAQLFSLCHFPERGLIAAGNMEGGVHWIDTQQGSDVKNILAHERGVFGILPFGGDAVTLGGAGKLARWNLDRLRVTESLQLAQNSLRGATALADGQLLVGASDRGIYQLDKDLGLGWSIPKAHGNSVFCLRPHPDGKRFVSGGRDARINLWGLGGKPLGGVDAHRTTVNDLRFSPDGEWLASASRDKSIRIWRAKDLTLVKEINAIKHGGHVNSVNRLLWLDEVTLVSASDDRTLIIWELHNK